MPPPEGVPYLLLPWCCPYSNALPFLCCLHHLSHFNKHAFLSSYPKRDRTKDDGRGGVPPGGHRGANAHAHGPASKVHICDLLFAVCCLLAAVCCLLSAVCCLLSAVCCLLSAVCCLLSAACYLLFAVCCLVSGVRSLLRAVLIFPPLFLESFSCPCLPLCSCCFYLTFSPDFHPPKSLLTLSSCRSYSSHTPPTHLSLKLILMFYL
jgi:hypothetical protein